MQSNHPNTTEQTENWLERAKRKWSGATITGTGSHSVRLMDGKNIRLFERFEDAAEFCSQDPKYKYLDLAEEPVRKTNTTGFANIKSMSEAEDRDWERRFDREKRERG